MGVSAVRDQRVAVWHWRAPENAFLLLPLAFMITTLPHVRPHVGYNLALDGVLNNLGYAAAPVVCFLRWRRAETYRMSWLLLTIGLALYGSGNVYWTIFIRPMAVQPFPSVADGLFLSFYPFAFVALLLLIRERAERMPVSLWLDGLVGGFAGAAVAASAVLGPSLSDTTGSWTAVATTTAYPVLDLLLLFLVVVTLAAYGWHPPFGLWLLTIGIAMFVLADVAYLIETAHDTYVSGKLTDGVWIFATVLMSMAPGWRERTRDWRLPSWALLAIPIVSSLAAMGVLAVDHIRRLHPIAIGLAMLTVVVALVRLVVTFREVASLSQSHRLALTDELTGLANRRALYEEPLTSGEDDSSELVGLLLLDLDRFKEINDSLGHHAGDEMLKDVARRLTESALPELNLIVRLGGDEFAVLLPNTSEATAVELAGDIRERISAPFLLDGVTVRAEASVGIALALAESSDMATLLRHADVAMYEAKGHHLGHSVFKGSGDAIVGVNRLRTLELIRAAIAERTLMLHYQPKVNARTHKVCGVEALVRWQHPDEGLLYPDRFLPLVEDSGLMAELTTSVLEQALDQVAAWTRDGRQLSVAVNLSASSLIDVELPQRVRDMLAARGLPPQALEIEITEDFLMADRQRARDVLATLRSLGIRVAVDDFGTGYSSLAYLRELPIDELKLDKSFVMTMGEDARAAAIVRSTIGLAHSLGLSMVAEGVETAAAASELAGAGCDVAQGFFFAKGLPAADLERWLDNRPEAEDQHVDVPAPRGAQKSAPVQAE
jgi:diguanylate cyclase (GGDEF)-like protein